MVETNDLGNLYTWLSDRPRPWAQAIALRAGLRVLPIGLAMELPPLFAETATNILLRCSAISWAAGAVPNLDLTNALHAAKAAFDAAYDRADSYNPYTYEDGFHSMLTAHKSVRAVCEPNDYADWCWSTADSSYAVARYPDLRDDVISNVFSDFDFLAALNTADSSSDWQALVSRPLWPDGMPFVPANAWAEAARSLRNQGLGLWADWYQHRLDGKAYGVPLFAASDREFQLRLLKQNNNWWERGMSEVTREIKTWISELRSSPAVE